MKTDLFQSCGHCWVFQICCHIECSTLTASSFRIWNSSTGIPSPLLALFVVMLFKAHLTSPSRMSGSRWVITSSWLSGSWRSFCTVDVYPRELKTYVHTKASIQMLVAALFFIDKAWKQSKCLSVGEQISKLWSTQKRHPFHYRGLNAEFQRIARRDKKAFFSDQCKEIEENNRMGKTRDRFKKIRYQRNISCKDGLDKGQKWSGHNRSRRY